MGEVAVAIVAIIFFIYFFCGNATERYPTKYTRSVKVQILSGMNDVIDVICTLLLSSSIDAVYDCTVP